MPRFQVRVVGTDGSATSQRRILDDCVRMEDKEEFRLLFDCDWLCGGTFQYCYDGGDVVTGTIAYEEMYSPPTVFTYTRSKPGSGRLLEVGFKRTGIDDEYHIQQIMLINNDYLPGGRVLRFGDTVDEADVVRDNETERE